MGKAWVMFVILLLIGGGVYLYYKYEKPKQENINEMTNLSIYAIDDTGRLIKTGYDIYSDNSLLKSGETLSQAPILEQVPKNSFIEVKNRNIDFQNYYFCSWNNSLIREENISRVKLDLIEPSPIEVNKLNNLNFSLQTSREFRNLIVCVKYTVDFIYVKALNYTEMENKPKLYEDYDKCYATNITIKKGEIKYLNLVYKIWGSLDPKDNLKIAFIDSDNGITELNETDQFAKDFIYNLDSTDFSNK